MGIVSSVPNFPISTDFPHFHFRKKREKGLAPQDVPRYCEFVIGPAGDAL